MTKILDCKEIGIECDYVACAPTEEEVIQDLGKHIQDVHAMKGFSKEFYRRAYASMREGICHREDSIEESLCNASEGACVS